MLCKFNYYEYIEVEHMGNQTAYANQTKSSIRQAISGVSNPEIVLIFWVFSLLIDEVYQVNPNLKYKINLKALKFSSQIWKFYFGDSDSRFKIKFVKYFENHWNYIDIVGCTLFTIGTSLRFVSFVTNEDIFICAR